MIDFDDDFGSPAPEVSNLIPFPAVRPNRKLSDAWSAEVHSSNHRGGHKDRLVSPIEAIDDMMRQRAMPAMAWPAPWPGIARRCRTYVKDMVGIVGSQGGGKTSFAIQVAIANTGDGTPALWWAGELDAAQLVSRIAANMHAVHSMAVRDGWSRDQIAHAMASITDMWRFIERRRDPDESLDVMRRAIEIAHRVYRRPPILIVDHVGKLAVNARDPRIGTVNALERLRELTDEMECFTIALSQGSRANQATLTGKTELGSATDALGVAAESKSFEDDCANVIALSLFKLDDAIALDAHALVGKARHTGLEGREGMRFSKPGGVWHELNYVPATPGEISTAVAAAKRDKHRTGPAPTPTAARADLNAAKAGDADAARRVSIFNVLARHGALGMDIGQLRRVPGVGRGGAFNQALQELERAGSAERIPGNKWRAILRGNDQ